MVFTNIYKCLKSAWRKLEDIQPKDPPTDPKCLLWYERVKCSRFDLVVPLLQVFFVLLDAGLDLKVAVIHYKDGYPYWALYTFIIVVITQIFLQLVSAFWFIEDLRDENSEKGEALEENDLGVKLWMIICHAFLLGRFLRFYQTWKVVRKIRSQGKTSHKEKSLENDENARGEFIRRHQLYISQTVDSNILGLIEAFMEGAPQVMLQLHILFQQSHVDLTSSNNLVVVVTILKSLLLFAFSHVSFTRNIRKEAEDSAQLEWFSKGALSLCLWRFFMLVSRVLVLALFASTFKACFTSVLIALRFLVFVVIVAKQECDFFEESPKKQNLLKLAFAYIHIFCFFPLVSGRTQKLGFTYYYITFVENSVILMLWVFYSSWGTAIKIVAIVVVNISFIIGLACLALYYRRFHPSIVQTRKDKPRVQSDTVVDSSETVNLYHVTSV